MSNIISPLTGIIPESEVVISFGKHKGQTIESIALNDPSVYELLCDKRKHGIFGIRRQRKEKFELYLTDLANQLSAHDVATLHIGL
jgi:hypothetical protein